MISTLSVVNLLYGCEDFDTTVIECIDAMIDGIEYPLNESIEILPRLSEYSVLIESVDEITNVKKEIKNIKNEKDPEKINNIFDRIIKALKNAFNWWYKIDPEKKHKTLHTVLKLLVSVLGIIFVIWGPGKAAIIKNVAARLPVGYEGTNGVLKFFFSKTKLASIMVASIYGEILKVIHNIDTRIEAAVNTKDIDKSIKEYDKAIDMINEMLSEVGDPQIKMHLEKTKANIEKSLSDLIKIKERIEKK
jgi:hypothetical protein